MAIDKLPQCAALTEGPSCNLCSAKGPIALDDGYWVGLFDAMTVTGVSR
jgi:hypothetical protein